MPEAISPQGPNQPPLPHQIVDGESQPLQPSVVEAPGHGFAPEVDPITGAIDAEPAAVAAAGIEVTAEAAGRHHRSEEGDAEPEGGPAIQVEFTRLQQAKQNMISIFGQDVYDTRFANNPHVDPDAFVQKLQNEAPAGRHAAPEDVPAVAEAQPAVTPEEPAAEAVEEARKVVKSTLSELAKDENFKLRWSEEEEIAKKLAAQAGNQPGAQPAGQKIDRLTLAANMGDLRFGWADDEPDPRNVFLNRQRRRSKPFFKQSSGPRTRTQEQIDALTTPLASSSEVPSPEAENEAPVGEAAPAPELTTERPDTVTDMLEWARQRMAAGEEATLERPAGIDEATWGQASTAQRLNLLAQHPDDPNQRAA